MTVLIEEGLQVEDRGNLYDIYQTDMSQSPHVNSIFHIHVQSIFPFIGKRR